MVTIISAPVRGLTSSASALCDWPSLYWNRNRVYLTARDFSRLGSLTRYTEMLPRLLALAPMSPNHKVLRGPADMSSQS